MIISPARFEDKINNIYSTADAEEDWDFVNRNAFKTMLETLESMGYAAGTARIRKEEK